MEHLLNTSSTTLRTLENFEETLTNLLKAKNAGFLKPDSGGPELVAFASSFSDREAVSQRLMAYLQDQHQQPAPLSKVDGHDLTPAWLDFLVADMTWKHSNENEPAIRVPPWLPPNAGNGKIKGVGGAAI